MTSDPVHTVFCTKCDALDNRYRQSLGNFTIDMSATVTEMRKRGGVWTSTADYLENNLKLKRPSLWEYRRWVEPGTRSLS
jgi:hypothetical protein